MFNGEKQIRDAVLRAKLSTWDSSTYREKFSVALWCHAIR